MKNTLLFTFHTNILVRLLTANMKNFLNPQIRNCVHPLSPVQTDATLLANNSQHCWMLHVASFCTPCWMLLDVVACCCAKFETGQSFQPTTPNISFVPWSPKRSATMLDPFAQLFQHCCNLRSGAILFYFLLLWLLLLPVRDIKG